MKDKDKLTGLEIAVIGMSGRFPGAANISEFWDNLKNGRESVTFFTDQELAEAGVDARLISDPAYVKAAPVLADKEYFDAPFFGYSPAEAEVLAPHVRIFFECAWAALEDAGWDPLSYEGAIGCYVGSSSSFGWRVLSYLSGRNRSLGDWASMLLSERDNLATHLAYKLDLKGPCFSFFTACSTSLTAVHLAARALLTGECRMALAGGICLDTSGKPGYLYSEGMILSPDGHCRSFDAEAKGTIFGEGAGAVVLKRLRDAEEDGDFVYAVVKGSAVNNDGSGRVGYTAPGMRGQRDVIKQALKIAKVSPESIGYVETHGTGTPLGDPVEIAAMTEAFGTSKKQYCGIGAVKTNIGHLDAAAGIAGFIKTVLALYHREIPPTLHFEKPNPQIDFENSPFYVVTEPTEWKADPSSGAHAVGRAGVSSFGIGGTNAHVILEEFPEQTGSTKVFAGVPGAVFLKSAPRPPEARKYKSSLILFSARTESALEKMTANLIEYLKQNPDVDLADVAYTLQVGRRVFNHRRTVVGSTTGEVIEALSQPGNGRVKTYTGGEDLDPPLIFMFPGLGSQYVDMGRELYEQVPFFRAEMERCFEVLKELGHDIKSILYPEQPSAISHQPSADSAHKSDTSYSSHAANPGPVSRPEIAQAAIFIFEYALAKLLMVWGLKPRALIGYSFGEYAAACIAGVFSLEDALKLVVARGKLIEKTAAGAMLSVPLPMQGTTTLLEEHRDLDLAAAIDNGPSCVIAGEPVAVSAFEARLKEKKILCMPVPVSTAIHSPLMAPILEDFEAVVRSITLDKPQIPYVSNVTGTWIRADQAVDPAFWAAHLRQTVLFADGLSLIAGKEGNALFVEVGPGRDLSALAVRYTEAGACPQPITSGTSVTFSKNLRKTTRLSRISSTEKNSGQHIVNLVRRPQQDVPDVDYLLDKIGRLWLHGKKSDWKQFYPETNPRRIPLPTYPFDRHYYPAVGDPMDYGMEALNRPTDLESKTFPAAERLNAPPREWGLEKKPDIADWFYIPSWKRWPALSGTDRISPGPCCWLVFADQCGLAAQLAARLRQRNQQVISVTAGDNFSKTSDCEYTIDPRQTGDYEKLLTAIKASGQAPAKVLHLWSVSGSAKDEPGNDVFDKIQESGLYSLLYLARAVAGAGLDFDSDLDIIVVSDHIQEVSGREQLNPAKSTVLALVRVIPQEYPYIRCRSIDIELPPAGGSGEKKLVDLLISEISRQAGDTVIAFRDGYRWMQVFEPLRLAEAPADAPMHRLKQGGVYLITGGLGGLGFTLARFLAEMYRARLVLTGRSSLPPENEWQQCLAAGGSSDKTVSRIAKMRELKDLGAEALFFPVDAADREEMARVVNLAEERFGSLNGVIHAAGVLGSGAKDTFRFIENIEKKSFVEQFRAKVYGLMALADILENKQLDFCLLTSSLSPILGGLGFSAYAAANRFMDAFVYKQNRGKNPVWLCLNWGDWQPWEETGQKTKIGAAQERLNMLPGEGIETFKRIMYHCAPGQVIVSSGDLQVRLEQWVALETLREQELPQKRRETSRPAFLSAAYAPPRSRTEQALAESWQHLFGFHRIGIHDDFFELGGDSLKAVTLSARIRKELDVEIPLTAFFDFSTIETLSRYIETSDRQTTAYAPLQAVEKRQYYPLSSAQERIYVMQQMRQDFTGYNDQVVFILEGKIKKDKLSEAFRQLIVRHESLRTTFVLVDNRPVQVVHSPLEIESKIEGAAPPAYNISNIKQKGDRQKEARTKVFAGGAGYPQRGHSLKEKGDSPQKISAGLHKSDMSYLSHLVLEFIRPFDLSQAPLLRIGLMELEKEKHLLIFDMHHIVFDGTSSGILLDEFAKCYAGEELPPLSVQYKDFAVWQHRLQESGNLEKQEAYWLDLFAGIEDAPRLVLPYDFPRPKVSTFAGDFYSFSLPAQETERFKAVALANDATLYMNLLTALNVLLYKYSGQEDITVGSGAAGRSRQELQPVIGMFVNTLALRSRPGPEKTYRQFLKEVKTTVIGAFENQDVHFETLVDKLNIERDVSRNPLFDVCLAYQNFELPRIRLGEMTTSSVEPAAKTSRFDMTLFAFENDAGMSFNLEYYTAIFKEETMSRFALHLANVIEQVNKDPGLRLSDLDILGEAEKKQLLYEFNDTFSAYPKDKTISQLFQEQAEKSPHRAAVVGWSVGYRLPDGGVRGAETAGEDADPAPVLLTYGELNRRAARLSRLLSAKGSFPGAVTAIMLDRSIEMIIGILGVLKSGAAYLPIELGFPAERVRYMLADSGAKLLLTTTGLLPEMGSLEMAEIDTLCIDSLSRGEEQSGAEETSSAPASHSSDMPHMSYSSNLSYIIYTSGTTGKPKGVVTLHHNVIRVVRNTNYINITPDQRVLQLSNYAFDGSVFDIFGALLNGAALVMLKPGEILELDKLAESIKKEKVSVFFVTTALFNALVDHRLDCFSGVKKVLFGGERVSVEHARKTLEYMGKDRIIHVYGPTETTVYASYYFINSIEDAAATIPIGKSLANTTIYILDKNLNPVPIGVNGEIYIGGDGLARGYLNNPELTAEKFKTAPAFRGTAHPPSEGHTAHSSPIANHRPQVTLYKTGDIGRWLPGGHVEFIGRMDHQVKLRGFRIELGEIESRLLSMAGIKEALVLDREDSTGQKFLCAYIVGETEVDSREVIESLSKTLPAYMIPAHFVQMERIPLNPNGKVDKKQLPLPEMRAENTYRAPRNEEEEKMVEIWSEVLGIKKEAVGIDDDFFRLGGNSLKAAVLAARIHETFSVKIQLAAIFEAPRVKDIVSLLTTLEWISGEKESGQDVEEVII